MEWLHLSQTQGEVGYAIPFCLLEDHPVGWAMLSINILFSYRVFDLQRDI
ncbi:protein of unknown function [Vibrio tapetis subsp. tapetis]|uniref:Uncharacterized protein n=1 Tax=Vibrio tapetis subsp. tapetis TaxID=1671868 RepID=A0A2N8ZCP0_9VIBR|nr:protein of unknown function [Vibrio tapetis subsp. tapetis]